jgi:hypothetical protein
MSSILRATLGAVVGAAVALALAYLAAVIVLLVTVGIPLGAQPRSPTPVEYIVLLLAGAAAAAAGARVAARVATPYQRHALVIQACLLPPFLIWLFFNSPGWPAWWGPALGAAMAAGTAITAASARRKRGAYGHPS